MRTIARCSALILIIGAILFSVPATARDLIDQAGRPVSLPDHVARVATVGPVPVLNSFVFAFGEARTLVNGLPPNLGGPRWKYQEVFAPGLGAKPVVQGAERGASAEEILALAPDVVLTMDRATVDALSPLGLKVVYLAWARPDDIKSLMRLMGTILDKPQTAEAYGKLYDDTLERVSARLSASPPQRPRVLFASLKRLTQPHLIADWWIDKAGGHSVTGNGRTVESYSFSLEQMLAWDPQVLIVADHDDLAAALTDPRFANLSAVRSGRVHVAPMGAHLWAHRTSELPLMVLWAAKTIHPELFADIDLAAETAAFYRRFFGKDLNPAEIADILSGRAGL